MQFDVTIRILITADSQGEALAGIEKRVRARGTSEQIPAQVWETVSIKPAGRK